MNRNKYNW